MLLDGLLELMDLFRSENTDRIIDALGSNDARRRRVCDRSAHILMGLEFCPFIRSHSTDQRCWGWRVRYGACWRKIKGFVRYLVMARCCNEAVLDTALGRRMRDRSSWKWKLLMPSQM